MPVYIRSCASVVSKKEGQGPLGELFDLVLEDDKSGADTWKGQRVPQREALSWPIEKSGLKRENINRYLREICLDSRLQAALEI